LAHFADERAGGAVDGAGIAGIGAGLLAADVHLGGAVDAFGKVYGAGRLRRRLGRLEHLVGGLQFLLPRALQIDAHAFAAAFAAEAGFLVAAEADRGIEVVGAVDPDDAGLDLGRDVEGDVDVLAPDGGGEAVAGVVGERHRLLVGAEAHGDENGAEDLLGRDRVAG